MKSLAVKFAVVVLVFLSAAETVNGQFRLFRQRRTPRLAGRVNPAHERAKTAADSSYQKGDYERSVRLTSTVIFENPRDHVALYIRASARVEIALRRRNVKEMRAAIADAREAIRLNGVKSPLYYLPYLYGMTHLSVLENRKEHAEVAVQIAGQVIRIPTLKNEEKANLYYQRGNSQVVLKAFNDAGNDFSAAIKLSPAHIGAHLGAADAYAQAGSVKKAIAAYGNAVLSFPNNPLVHNNRGMYLQQQGKLDEAILDFTQALVINSKYHYSYTNRGFCLQQMGNAKAAEADFTASLKLDPNQATVFGMRATARLAQGNLAGAVEDNQTVVKMNPRSSSAYADLGFALFFSENYAGANQSFVQAATLDANQRQLNPWRFLALELGGDRDAALKTFAASLGKKPEKRDWADSLLAYLAGRL
ncbi:MAG: tetratricopeptide repeat protein, partial [Planctomycetes bacterium]|nr:tetratricopeptide repeat protein [Planctomycetota bacterium]